MLCADFYAYLDDVNSQWSEANYASRPFNDDNHPSRIAHGGENGDAGFAARIALQLWGLTP